MLTAQATREIVALFARCVSMKRFITRKRVQRGVRFEVHVKINGACKIASLETKFRYSNTEIH